ncbi:MAG: hypothetical protein J6Q54_02470 [Oscillospiraceae bacterium]|nr:hypothetical protein [Oscillospiraceae bacterium]
MEFSKLKEKVNALFRKYKYPLIVLLLGLIFILIPSNKETQLSVTEVTQVYPEETSFEHELADILSKVKGAGRVEVMLTVSKGEEVLYQTDNNITSGAESSGTKTSTVIVSDSNRAESGLVRQVNPAVYYGAIILCQGADDPAVKLALTEAVSRITGIGTNCISVLKMS